MTDDPQITDRLFAAICRQKFKLAKTLIPLMIACDMNVDKSEENGKWKILICFTFVKQECKCKFSG